MALSSSFECSICMYRFDFDTERKPMSLLCGHTYCKTCISQFVSKTCPDCRTAFIAPAPNFNLWNIISALASTSASASDEPQFKKAVQDQIQAINNQVLSKQVEVTKCEANVEITQKKAIQAQNELLAASEDMRQLHAALLPLKVSLGFTGPHLDGAPNGKGSGGGCKVSSAPLLVVLATSSNLGDILNNMSITGVPAIYDFQGKDMTYSDRGSPTIYVGGVVWRNGSITLQAAQSLVVTCPGVVLESVIIKGGINGVWMQDGSSISMTGCEVRASGVALMLDTNTSAVASNLGISHCSVKAAQLNGSSCLKLTGLKMVHQQYFPEGFVLTGSSSATFTDCTMSDITGDAFNLDGASSLVGTAVTVSGAKKNVLNLRGTAKAALTGCMLMKNGILVSASGESRVVLTRCASDGEIKKIENATVTVNRV